MKFIILIAKLSSVLTLCILIQYSLKQCLADIYQIRAQSKQRSIDSKLYLITKAVNLNSHNAELHESLGQLYLDKTSQTPVNTPEFLKNAITSFQNAIQLNPTNYKYHLLLAHSNFKLDNDPEKFINKLSIIEKLDPHNEIISKYKNQLR